MFRSHCRSERDEETESQSKMNIMEEDQRDNRGRFQFSGTFSKYTSCKRYSEYGRRDL